MDIVTPNSTVEVPKAQLLRYHQREELRSEIETMESMMPNLKTPTDRGEVSKRLKRLKQTLDTQSPHDLSGSEKDQLYRESKELEASITQGMLTSEEMRKNPAGSVGQHLRWERHNKKGILRWKNVQQMLDPSSDDPDLSNFERLRPTGAMDRIRLDAQIPGQMSYRTVPQEHWDQAFQGAGPTNSALQQAKRVHEEEPKKRTRFMSEEAKLQAKESLARAREIRKERIRQGLTAQGLPKTTTETPNGSQVS